MTGIGSAFFPQVGRLENVLEFFYFGFMTMSFGTALFCLFQATIVTTYGPAMALSGDSGTSVKYAAGHMKLQQDFVFNIGFVCISSFFVGAICLSWARRPTGQAILNTLIYLGSFALLVVKGFQVYKSVNAYGSIDSEDNAMLKKGGGGHRDAHSEVGDGYSSVRKSEHAHSEEGGSHHHHHSHHHHNHHHHSHHHHSHHHHHPHYHHQHAANKSAVGGGASEHPPADSEPSELGIRAMGQLWFRDSIDLGGQLHERFAVLQRGVLEVYRHERDFDKGKDPINEIPFQLTKYLLELDTKKFKRGLTSGKKSFRRLVSGQGEISLPVYVASEFDLKTAVKRFQFIIHPKVLSEVHPLPVGEFMANDEQSYKQWVAALQGVIQATQSLPQNNVVNRAMT
jgi:hypothetical protein